VDNNEGEFGVSDLAKSSFAAATDDERK